MKKLFILSIIFIMIVTCLLTACTKQDAGEASAVIPRKTVRSPGTAYREGDKVVIGGKPVTLHTVNFDNLTWFSQDKLDDGTPVYKLHHSEADYDRIQSLGFNTVRYFIKWNHLFNDRYSQEENKEGFEWLDQNIAWAKQRGIYVILDFHCPYGGFGTEGDGAWPIWSDEKAQEGFARAWGKLAQRYSNDDNVIAYDLMNEPSLAPSGSLPPREAYAKLMDSAIAEIRKADPYKLVIVEAAVGVDGESDSWNKPNWVKVSDTNVMYSFHFYEPLLYTHNGSGIPKKKVQYPAPDFGQKQLEAAFEAYMSVPKTWGYPILIGELGCYDWSAGTGAVTWLNDVYALCKKNDIHPAFFSYRAFIERAQSPAYSFSISNMLYSADGSTKPEEVTNEELNTFFTGLSAYKQSK